MYGLELISYKTNDLIVENSMFEDNFCDGINLSSEDQLEDISLVDPN